MADVSPGLPWSSLAPGKRMIPSRRNEQNHGYRSIRAARGLTGHWMTSCRRATNIPNCPQPFASNSHYPGDLPRLFEPSAAPGKPGQVAPTRSDPALLAIGVSGGAVPTGDKRRARPGNRVAGDC